MHQFFSSLRLTFAQPARLIAVVAIAGLWAVGPVFAEPPKELNDLRVMVSELEKDLNKPVEDFNALYEKQLDELENTATASSNLDLVLAIRAERSSYKSLKSASSSFPELRRLQDIYKQRAQVLIEEKNQKERNLTTAYLAQLADLQDKLTEANRIDDAVAIRNEINKVKAANDLAVAGTGQPETPTGPVQPAPSDLPESGGQGAAAALKEGGRILQNLVPPPGHYRLKDDVIVGESKTAKVALTLLPQTHVEEGKIIVDNNALVANGTKFEESQLICALGSTLTFRNCLLENSRLSKKGGWFVDRWSAKFILDNCAICDHIFPGFNPTDHGIKITNCTFYNVEFPNSGFKKPDALAEANHEWRTLENCRFENCTIPEFYLLISKGCVFKSCKFIPQELDKVTDTFDIQIAVEGRAPSFKPANDKVNLQIDELGPLDSASSAGCSLGHRYTGGKLVFSN